MSIVPPEDGDGHDHVEQSSIGIDDKRRSAVLILHPAHQADVHIGIRPQLRHDDLRIKASPIRSLLGARAQSDEHALGAGRMVDGDADLILAEPQIGDRCRCWRPTRFHCPPPDRATRCEARPRTLPSRRGRSRGPTAAIATASTGPVARSRAIGPRQLRSESSEWSRTRLIAIPIRNPQSAVISRASVAPTTPLAVAAEEVRIPSVCDRRIVTQAIEPQRVAFIGALAGTRNQEAVAIPQDVHLRVGPIVHHHARGDRRERCCVEAKDPVVRGAAGQEHTPPCAIVVPETARAPVLPDWASLPDRTRRTPARPAPRPRTPRRTRARTREAPKAGREGRDDARRARPRCRCSPEASRRPAGSPDAHVQPISLASGVGPAGAVPFLIGR